MLGVFITEVTFSYFRFSFALLLQQLFLEMINIGKGSNIFAFIPGEKTNQSVWETSLERDCVLTTGLITETGC